MDKQVFIDFGCGPNMSQAIKFKENGYYVILVEKSEQDLYENTHINDIEYYKVVADEIFFFDITDVSRRTTYLADVWNCGAVLEHVEPNQIDPFLLGIKNNCKNESQGVINIDLTDHFGGFDHRDNPDNYNFIKNLYEEKEWYYIIEKHFSIQKWSKDFKADALKNGLFTMIGPKKKFQIVNSGDCIGVGFNVFV